MMPVLTKRQALDPIFPKSKSPPKLQPHRLTLSLIMAGRQTKGMFPDSECLDLDIVRNQDTWPMSLKKESLLLATFDL